MNKISTYILTLLIVFEMNLSNLLIVFTIFIAVCVTERCRYSNSVIICDDFNTIPTDYWYCDIFAGSNTDLIRNVIKNCTTEEYSHKISLRIFKFATFDVPLTVELDVGPNVTEIWFVFTYTGNVFQVRSIKIHPSVTRMSFTSEEFILLQSNFFEYFPNLTVVTTLSSMLLFNSIPSFQNNTNLMNLAISMNVGNGFILSTSLTRGLSSLTRLSLTNSGIQSITQDALDTVTELTELVLQDNQISYLQAGLFEKLTNLEILDLDNNQITSSSPDAFYGLDSLTSLSLDGNDDFPVNVLSQLDSLENLILGNNNYTMLNPFTFQQLGMLTYVDLRGNPLDCNCELQWLSYVANYGITLRNAICSSPINSMGSDATSPGVYSGCGSLEEFTCFNKSVTCPYNQVCQNIANFHFCCCPEDHRMIATGDCVVDTQCRIPNQTLSDTFNGCGCNQGYQHSPACTSCIYINECEIDNGGCEQNCENTIGSSRCSCNTGYVLHNITQCDVNECQDDGLVCNGICENTIGGYSCHCWQGFTQQNGSLCVDIDECATMNAGCEHLCHNTQGSYFCSCYDGFNFSSTDIHVCQSLNSQTIFTNPTTSITAIGIIVLLVFLLIIQTIVCVLCVYCVKRNSIKKIANPSNQVTNLQIANSIQTVTGNTNAEPPYVEMSPAKTDSGAWKNRPNKIEAENPYYETVPTGNTLLREETSPIVYGEIESSKTHYENSTFIM